MTRNDYKLIASVIAGHMTERNKKDLLALAVRLAAEFKQDNPNFKEYLFIDACVTEE